jgi:hypothetical protein
MEQWKFDHHELPLVPGGYRAGLTSGIAKCLGAERLSGYKHKALAILDEIT